jgi:hypothetical protein
MRYAKWLTFPLLVKRWALTQTNITIPVWPRPSTPHPGSIPYRLAGGLGVIAGLLLRAGSGPA